MSQARQAIYQSFKNPDPASHGVFKMIQNLYPSFATKIFENNEFMRNLVMSGLNPMHILDYPVCGRCETLASMSGYAVSHGKRVDVCTCHKCGSSTRDPILFKEWLTMEMKRKAPPDFVESVEYAIDLVAQSMVRKYFQDTRELFARESAEQKRKLGIVDSFGNPINRDVHHEVTLEVTSDRIDLAEEAKKIGMEENLDVLQADE